ncbi:hypothetical protein ABVT39_013143 [Epinephelus coioides]
MALSKSLPNVTEQQQQRQQQRTDEPLALSKRSDLLNPLSYRGRSEKADFTEEIISSRRRVGTGKSQIHFPKRIIQQSVITLRYQNRISSVRMTRCSLIS